MYGINAIYFVEFQYAGVNNSFLKRTVTILSRFKWQIYGVLWIEHAKKLCDFHNIPPHKNIVPHEAFTSQICPQSMLCYDLILVISIVGFKV